MMKNPPKFTGQLKNDFAGFAKQYIRREKRFDALDKFSCFVKYKSGWAQSGAREFLAARDAGMTVARKRVIQ